MTETEFYYWLQGFFELSGTAGLALTVEQAKCIGRHAALVRASGQDVKLPFIMVEFLALVLDDALVQPADRVEFTSRVQAEIAGQFIHVIDPSSGTPEQVAEKQAIHDGPDRGQ
jgi:hypothetical protein